MGKRLYERPLELLTRQNLRTVCAGITLPNAASVALHEACGFELVGIYRHIGYKFGRWHDVGWWQLQLPDPPTIAPTGDPGPPLRLSDSGDLEVPAGSDQ